jgi:hypothetical protein
MIQPLKMRMQFSCGTLSTTFLVADEHHPEQISSVVIDPSNLSFQQTLAKELMPRATALVDGQVGEGFSKVTQEITYTVLGTRVTLGVALTVRAPGHEAELGHLVAEAMAKYHPIVDVVHDLIETKAKQAEYEEAHPEEFPERSSSHFADMLDEFFGGNANVMFVTSDQLFGTRPRG